MPNADLHTTVVRLLAVAALSTLAGCATVQSIDFPWKETDSEEAGSEEAGSEEAGSEEAGASAGADENPKGDRRSESAPESRGADRTERAVEWASRAVSASRRLAYGTGIQRAAQSNPEVVASAESRLRRPHGVWRRNSRRDETGDSESASSSSNGPIAEAPSTRSIERDSAESGTEDVTPRSSGADSSGGGTDPASTGEADSSDPSKDSQRTETGADGTPVRTISGAQSERSSTPGSLGWPVGIPGDSADGSAARTVVDPTIDTKVYRLDDSEERKEVADRWGLSPPSADGAVAIPGTFLENVRQYDEFERLDDKELDRQVAVVVPGDRVAIYAGEREVATKEFPDTDELPEKLSGVRPVRAVRDGTTQLLLFWTESADKPDDARTYRVGILKAIGPLIGTIFERTVATRTDSEAELRRSGYLEFLRGSDHRFLQWTPATDGGEPVTEEASILQWNEWEGVYRAPKPPPTAPDQRS